MPNLALPFLAGTLASLLFLFISASGLGFLFLFLPTLPIFALGLSAYSRLTWVSIASGAGLTALAAGDATPALVFLGFLGIPTWYLARGSVIRVPLSDGKAALWLPIGML